MDKDAKRLLAAEARNLASYVNTFTRLRSLDARTLVGLALKEMPEEISLSYEQIIEELCSRVHPEWVNESDEPLTLTQALRLKDGPSTVP